MWKLLTGSIHTPQHHDAKPVVRFIAVSYHKGDPCVRPIISGLIGIILFRRPDYKGMTVQYFV